MIEHRYEEKDGIWSLASYGKSHFERLEGRKAADMPLWLQEIVGLAKVGNHLTVNVVSENRFVVWFQTDENNRLITFLSLGEQLSLDLDGKTK